MNPWVILSLRLSSGQLKIEAEDSGGHRFPAARPWVGFIPATALRGAGLNAQTKVLVPEVWPPQARVVYLRLPDSIASRDWDPLIRIVLGHAASVARYGAPAVGGLRPFELPLRIVSMNQVRPYLNSFLRHNWVKETQRRGGLEVDDQVTFRWRDSAHNNEHKLMTLALDEFLRRFLLHLLPKGFVRIRHFGFLANRRRATLLAALLATPRRSTAIADRTRSLPGPGTQRTLALSQVWRPHDGHRETYRGPTPTPFSTLSRRSRRMKPQFQLPPWCASPLPAGVRPSCPQTKLPVPNLASNSRPNPTQTTTKPIRTALLFAPLPLAAAFLIYPTPLNLHKCFPTGGFLQTAVSDAPRRTFRVPRHTYCGARPIQH